MKKSIIAVICSAVLFISGCKTPNPLPPDPVEPIKSEKISYDFEDWSYDCMAWFVSGNQILTGTALDEKDEPVYFYDTKNVFYTTLNNLLAVKELSGMAPPELSTFPDTLAAQSGHGDYAARMVSQWYVLGTPPIFIPGVIGTFVVDMGAFANGDMENLLRLGRPHTTNDDVITLWYKYEPVNGDSAAIFVDLWKLNGTERDTIGSLRKVIKERVPEWKQETFDIKYKPGRENEKPDAMCMLFVSSAKFNVNNLFDCEGQVGSTLWIDDVEVGKKQ